MTGFASSFASTQRFVVAGTAAVVLVITSCFVVSMPHGFSGTSTISVQHDATPVAEPFAELVFKSRPRIVALAPAAAPRSASSRNWQLSFRARAMRLS